MNISLASMKKMISDFFNRFHFVVFIVLAVGGLAVSIFLLLQVVMLSDKTDGYSSTSNQPSFDKTTIEKIRSLKSSDEDSEKINTGGRSNPFIE